MYEDIVLRSIQDPHWKQQRTVLHSALKTYGEGIAEIEEVITHELEHVIKLLHARVDENDACVDLDDYLSPSILNIIYTVLNGERYDYDDSRIQIVVKGNTVANYLATPLVDTLLQTFPFLRYLPFGIGTTYRYVHMSSQVFLGEAFEKCRLLSDEERRNRKGVSYELLQKMETCGWLSLNLARGCVQDVGGAGNFTTKYSLLTFFLVMVHRLDIQEKIQEEIDDRIGRDRSPAVADKRNMPYTLAAILELTRYGSNVALSVPHACSEDTDFWGVTVPRGAVIIPNLFRVHHDEKLWKNPWDFDPTRFLDENGDVLPANNPIRQNLIAFGVGKRVCMGETFAKARLFLYITSLLQKFTITASEDVPSCDPRTYDNDFVIHPPQYKVTLANRI